jgi:hypothetical protein
MADSIFLPPASGVKFAGTGTLNSAQLSWNTFGASALDDGEEVVMTAEPRPTIVSARKRSA